GIGYGTLVGGAGDDILFAGGDDIGNVLQGGDGNDRLVSGQGQDGMIGQEGIDTFVFSTGTGADDHDSLLDFQSGQDVIELIGVGADFDPLAHLTDGANRVLGVTLTLDNGATIDIHNHTAADLQHSDFHIVS